MKKVLAMSLSLLLGLGIPVQAGVHAGMRPMGRCHSSRKFPKFPIMFIQHNCESDEVPQIYASTPQKQSLWNRTMDTREVNLPTEIMHSHVYDGSTVHKFDFSNMPTHFTFDVSGNVNSKKTTSILSFFQTIVRLAIIVVPAYYYTFRPSIGLPQISQIFNNVRSRLSGLLGY